MIIRQSGLLNRLFALFLATSLTFMSASLWAEESDKHENSVVLYGTSWCGYCQKARDYFNSLGIPFTDYDIETSAVGKQKYRALHGRGVPLILIGEQRIDGFDKSKIKRALKEHHLLKD